MSDDRAPGWLVNKIDQRLAKLENEAGFVIDASGAEVIMTPLSEPDEFGITDLDQWERSCDRCGVYTPEQTEQDVAEHGAKFFTGNLTHELKSGQKVIITFGCCKACRNLP